MNLTGHNNLMEALVYGNPESEIAPWKDCPEPDLVKIILAARGELRREIANKRELARNKIVMVFDRLCDEIGNRGLTRHAKYLKIDTELARTLKVSKERIRQIHDWLRGTDSKNKKLKNRSMAMQRFKLALLQRR